MTGTSLRRRATRVDHPHPPSYRPCTWHCLRNAGGVLRHLSTRTDSDLQAPPDLPSMHLALPQEMPEAFQVTPETYRFLQQASNMPIQLRLTLRKSFQQGPKCGGRRHNTSDRHLTSSTREARNPHPELPPSMHLALPRGTSKAFRCTPAPV